MIRIGFSRWQTIFENSPANNCMQRMCLKMIPYSKSYKVLYKKWNGLNSSMEVKDVQTRSFEVPFLLPRYQKISHTVEQLKRAALTLSSDVVRYCINNDILDSLGCEINAVTYLVNFALMRLIETGTSDEEQELIEEVDLVPDMTEMRIIRQREIEEQREQTRLAYQQHLIEQGIAREQALEKSNIVMKKSFDFLAKFLNVNEKEMLEKYKCIKISNLLGDFFIHPYNHSMVDQFYEGKYMQSHCVVFKDVTLPVGDEAAMKVALLKTDIKRFINISNKFKHNWTNSTMRMPF